MLIKIKIFRICGYSGKTSAKPIVHII